MPKVVDHAERRREIIYALWAVIYERGITGVTLQSVAAKAGVSVGRIQHYFASKHALVLAGAHAMLDASVLAWSEDAEDDPSEGLAALARLPIPRSEAFRLGSSVWYAYLATATADPQIGAVVRDAVRGGVETATRLLARRDGDEGGAAGSDEPRLGAVRLIALSNGLAQAVYVGALEADEALTVLDAEQARRPKG